MPVLLIQCQPHDILDNGTKVRVQNRQGTVVGHEIVPAIPSGMIVVHTVELTEQIHKVMNKWVWKPMPKPVTRKVNYSFLYQIIGSDKP